MLDVLEPVEWAHGRIEGAIHVRLMELPQRLGELPPGRRWRSARPAAALQAAGYLVQQEGEWLDGLSYGLLAEEWRA